MRERDIGWDADLPEPNYRSSRRRGERTASTMNAVAI